MRRSILTNDPRRLPGVDMRSEHGRRYRDIIESLISEFGPNADPIRLRELGGLKFSLEQIQVQVVTGSQRACGDLVRLSNLIARREGELRTQKVVTAPPKPPLRHRLAERAASRRSIPDGEGAV